MSSKVTRILAWIGVGALALLAVGLALRAVLNYSYGKKLESFLAEMKASGTPMTLKDVEPTCPAGDNGAPLWNAAAALLNLENEDKNLLAKGFLALRSRNAPGNDIRGSLESIIAKNQKAIQLMLDASRKPCFKDEEKWLDHDRDVLAARLVKLIGASRLLALDSVLKAEQGRIEEAVAECLAGFRLLTKGLEDAFMINDLVLVACAKQLVLALQVSVSGREFPAPLLSQIIAELDGSVWHDGMIRALRIERVLVQDHSLRAIRGIEKSSWLLRPITKSKIIWMAPVWDRIIRDAQRPYYESDGLSRAMKDSEKDTPWFLRTFIPYMATFAFKEATLEAFLEVTRLGIACKIYKAEHGIFPDSLTQLVPAILPSIPFDPFTGQPFIYKRTDSGINIYSVGSNKKDDGGRETWEITQVVMEKDDDWFWRETIR